MAWLFAALITLSALPPVVHLQTECLLITASELSGLISEALSSTQQGQTAVVQLEEHNVVCLAQGAVKDRYRMVSVVASYFLNGASVLTEGQFHFQCGSGSWTTNVLGNVAFSLSQPSSPVGNLTTPLRRDCRICSDRPPSFSDAEHCVGKNRLIGDRYRK